MALYLENKFVINMQKFQLRFTDSQGNGSFYYFETDKPTNIEVKACELANEVLQKERDKFHASSIFFKPFKPKRVVQVWEYDNETKGPKKKGYRFKIHYAYFKATSKGGQIHFNEWYQYEGE
jgi:hypothetical protein